MKPKVTTRKVKFCTYAPARQPRADRESPTIATARQPYLSIRLPANIPATQILYVLTKYNSH